MDPIDKASAVVGSATELAARIGVAQSAVSNWKARGKVPAEHCIAIERETEGAVTVEELRPDLDWAVIRGKSLPKRESVTSSR